MLARSHRDTTTYGLTVDALAACRPMPRISVGKLQDHRVTKFVNLHPIDGGGNGQHPQPVPTRKTV